MAARAVQLRTTCDTLSSGPVNQRVYRAIWLALLLIAFTGPWGPWEILWDARRGDFPLLLLVAAAPVLCLAALVQVESRALVVVFGGLALFAAVSVGRGLYKPFVDLIRGTDTRLIDHWGASLFLFTLLLALISEFVSALPLGRARFGRGRVTASMLRASLNSRLRVPRFGSYDLIPRDVVRGTMRSRHTRKRV